MLFALFSFSDHHQGTHNKNTHRFNIFQNISFISVRMTTHNIHIFSRVAIVVLLFICGAAAVFALNTDRDSKNDNENLYNNMSSSIPNRGSLLMAVIHPLSDGDILNVYYDDMNLGLGDMMHVNLPALADGESYSVAVTRADTTRQTLLVILTKQNVNDETILGHYLYQIAYDPLDTKVLQMVSGVEQPLSLKDSDSQGSEAFEKSQVLSISVNKDGSSVHALVYHSDDDAVYLYTLDTSNGEATLVFQVNVPSSTTDGKSPLEQDSIEYYPSADRFYALSTAGRLYQINPHNEEDLQSLDLSDGHEFTVERSRVVADHSQYGKGKLYIAPNTADDAADRLPLFIIEPNLDQFSESKVTDVTSLFQFDAFRLSRMYIFSDVVMVIDSVEEPQIIGFDSKDASEVFRSADLLTPSPFQLTTNGIRSSHDHIVHANQCFDLPSFDNDICSSRRGRLVTTRTLYSPFLSVYLDLYTIHLTPQSP